MASAPTQAQSSTKKPISLLSFRATLGQKLRLARLRAGMTQQDLANRLGVTRPAITQWESSQTEPSHKHLFKAAELLNGGNFEEWARLSVDFDRALFELANRPLEPQRPLRALHTGIFRPANDR